MEVKYVTQNEVVNEQNVKEIKEIERTDLENNNKMYLKNDLSIQ